MNIAVLPEELPRVRVIAFLSAQTREALLHFGAVITPTITTMYHFVDLPKGWRVEERYGYGHIYDSLDRLRGELMRINQGSETTIQMRPWFKLEKAYDKPEIGGIVTVKVVDGNGTVIHLAESSPHPPGRHITAYMEAADKARQYLAHCFNGWTSRDVITYWS